MASNINKVWRVLWLKSEMSSLRRLWEQGPGCWRRPMKGTRICPCIRFLVCCHTGELPRVPNKQEALSQPTIAPFLLWSPSESVGQNKHFPAHLFLLSILVKVNMEVTSTVREGLWTLVTARILCILTSLAASPGSYLKSI